MTKCITKAEDGHYYEEIVTWDREPDVTPYIAACAVWFSAWIMVSFVFFIPGFNGGIQDIPAIMSVYAFISILCWVLLVVGTASLEELSRGKGKEVKYRRIK